MAKSNLQYTKGVRTRFFNTLDREIQHGSTLIDTETDYLSPEDCTILRQKVIECKHKINIYIEILNIQSEKLAQELGDSDSDLTESIIKNDSDLCDKAWSMDCKLQNLNDFLKEKMMYKVSDANVHDAGENIVENIVQKMCDMQVKMQQDFFEQQQQRSEAQMLLQQEFFEKQSDHVTKRAHSVKLPKLEMTSFCGNRLQWVEFWDSKARCTIMMGFQALINSIT